MWRSLVLMLMFMFTLAGCTDYDIDTFEISINPGVDTVQVNSTFVDEGATATIEGNARRVTIIENTVDTTEVGTYKIVYQASYRNTIIQAIRMVDVVDEEAPQISLNPGVDTVYVGDTWKDSGVSVTDNSKGNIHVSTEGTVNTGIAGEYIITYRAEDESGNIATQLRYVNVLPKNSND